MFTDLLDKYLDAKKRLGSVHSPTQYESVRNEIDAAKKELNDFFKKDTP